MITLKKFGFYRIYETPHGIRIIRLGRKDYVWIPASRVGDILEGSRRGHFLRNILAEGQYRLYDVADEPAYADLEHLELLAGDEDWQGYLLPSGLPKSSKQRVRIISTREVISGSKRISAALQPA